MDKKDMSLCLEQFLICVSQDDVIFPYYKCRNIPAQGDELEFDWLNFCLCVFYRICPHGDFYLRAERNTGREKKHGRFEILSEINFTPLGRGGREVASRRNSLSWRLHKFWENFKILLLATSRLPQPRGVKFFPERISKSFYSRPRDYRDQGV